ncbi:ubiquinone/menaquinone biosynthesis methyltransferase UbiE [Halorhodospira halochloris]|uniref:Ubiquinone/menaquinone biosynthesis C-methyltransferase UbiE n=1 Tax=Halorhodospira halochloris TaxID=1052 RepID=A0A0X8X6W9_HALHR|nr:bifunctional demethylmenaquinone methyltransferase/2-methoxy-6-polyprenyl-1,4-benzoquinol methylase UbiE [Halorhodospira halochloris]MBK1650810.1 bifunctional demethylmenaquinone methyltransferase/2-methoxy-6-polyprenyl-1,4-benzoquinol methylase [Halorhodospira halochloris]MCG5547164.1 bifunctional demethylmenaquinone methyltransferase/2-methoxy-6-polyprenyl-1,4-benzoquinol methylase UbiE [Halorhodospira halochloris]BAU56691.1 ubiquinone/menaquinone biosynthesis methyltransferase UbiE [Halorh
MNEDKTTHFGYQEVPVAEKARHVGSVFDSVADRYDLMNDLMSAGMHRLWKRRAIAQAMLSKGQDVLDLAGGTGDLARLALDKVGDDGHVVLSDINAAMLQRGRDRFINEGIDSQASYVRCDAEFLPFPDGSFDRVTIGFGLRNVTNKDRALAEMRRVLRPGGRAIILEFSHVQVAALRPFYDLYSFRVMPIMGKLIVDDPDSYRYLAESIRVHPDAQTLSNMMENAGFEDCGYNLLTAGVVAIHHGWVY